MYKSFLAPLILVLTALLSSCNLIPRPEPSPIPAAAVFVVCEGSLGNGNSALTLYDTDGNTAIEDVYKQANGHSLGDVFQSMTLAARDHYFLCINNSDRVVVISTGSFLDMGSISIPKPRYVLPVSESKVYVSTLFSNKVYVINPRTFRVTGIVDMPRKNPEGMAIVGKSAYICTWDTAATAIYPIDTATDVVGAPVQIAGAAPHDIVQDAEGMLWILSGNKSKGAEAKLTRIDPATGTILKSYAFGAADPMRLVLNTARDTLYFIEVSYSGGPLNNGVYRMGIHDGALPAQAFIPAQGLQYFYAIGIHPHTGNIYVADPLGFTQRGKVYIYTPDGSLVSTFSTGVGPGGFVFE